MPSPSSVRRAHTRTLLAFPMLAFILITAGLAQAQVLASPSVASTPSASAPKSSSSGAPSSSSSNSGNATSAGGATAAAAGGGITVDDQALVLWLNYAFLCVLATFFIVALPRLLARLTYLSTFTSGFLLRGAKVPAEATSVGYDDGMTRGYEGGRTRSAREDLQPGSRRPAPVGRSVSASRGGAKLHRQNTNATLVNSSQTHDRGAKWFGSSEQSHTLANHDVYGGGGSKTYSPTHAKHYPGKYDANQSPSTEDGGAPKPPPHFPSASALLYPLSAPLSYPITNTLSLGKLLLLVAYVAAVVTVVFVKGGAPLKDSERLGWCAAVMVPIVVALGTKNSIVGAFTVKGYERLNYLHRFAGIVLVVCANLHGFGYLYKWQLATPTPSTSVNLHNPANQAGFTALVGVDLIALTSMPFVRTRFYRLFFVSHIIGITTILVALSFHKAPIFKWALAAVGISGLDQLMRLVKTRVVKVRVRCLPELQSTRIEVPASVIGKGWRAGQHVRIRMLSTELGWMGWVCAHPFTIASAPGEQPGGDGGRGRGLELIVKKAGHWTGKLYDAAGKAGYYAGDDAYKEEREMRVIIEGPYGGLGNMVVPSYSAAVLVAGGSGITFPLSVMREAVGALRNGKTALRYVELVWTVQDKDSINPLLPTFSEILSSLDSLAGPSIILKISVYYSRVSKPSARSPEKDFDAYADSASAYLSALSARGLILSAGRPNLPKILEAACTFAGNLPPEQARGVAVASCGPAELVADVGRAARGVKGEVRDACGGVEVHEEMFGW